MVLTLILCTINHETVCRTHPRNLRANDFFFLSKAVPVALLMKLEWGMNDKKVTVMNDIMKNIVNYIKVQIL